MEQHKRDGIVGGGCRLIIGKVGGCKSGIAIAIGPRNSKRTSLLLPSITVDLSHARNTALRFCRTRTGGRTGRFFVSITTKLYR